MAALVVGVDLPPYPLFSWPWFVHKCSLCLFLCVLVVVNLVFAILDCLGSLMDICWDLLLGLLWFLLRHADRLRPYF